MANKIIGNDSVESTKGKTRLKISDYAGKIQDIIGTGKHAQESFVWITIKWSFSIGATVTLLIYIKSVLEGTTSCKIVDDIKNIWAVFTPLITLAIGYAFGKERR